MKFRIFPVELEGTFESFVVIARDRPHAADVAARRLNGRAGNMAAWPIGNGSFRGGTYTVAQGRKVVGERFFVVEGMR